MDKLNDNWITEGRIDFEYKKYLLLAYLKTVSGHFASNKLYPWLGDLVEHYRRVVQLLENKKKVEGAFPKELEQIDLQNFILRYSKLVQDDELMQEIERIVRFSAPILQKTLDEGKEVYEYLEQSIQIEEIGIVPIYKYSGYLFINNGEVPKVDIYRYEMDDASVLDRTYRLATQFVQSATLSIVSTYEAIKSRLLEKVVWQQPPAVYALETEFSVPMSETLLPIAKRLLLRRLVQDNNSM